LSTASQYVLQFLLYAFSVRDIIAWKFECPPGRSLGRSIEAGLRGVIAQTRDPTSLTVVPSRIP